jgi:3-hydroxyacyl-CoA dehydrogenase
MNVDTTSKNLLTEVRGRVGIVWLRRTPSNALSSKLSSDLIQALVGFLQQSEIDCVVLASGLTHFSAGSDSADFTHPQRGNKVEISNLCALVSDSKKPIVAAVHGACLSTGLELVVSATARIALAGAQFGFPDIKLGLMPAAGTTLRLPQLIGPEPALTMLLDGNAIGAEQAASIGLIDVLVQEDLIGSACDFSLGLATGKRRVQRRDSVKDARALQEAVVTARANYAGRHLASYDKIIACVEASQIFLPSQALALERSAYENLLFSADTQGLCYALLAGQKLRGLAYTQSVALPVGVEAADVQNLNIFGAGELVAQLARRALLAGLHVRLVNPEQEGLMNSLLRISALLVSDIAEGRLTVKTRDMIWVRLRSSKDRDLFDETSIVIGMNSDCDVLLTKSRQDLSSQKALLVLSETSVDTVVDPAAPVRTMAFLAGLFVKFGIATYDLARGGFVETQIKDAVSQAINYLQRQGHARDVIIAALASWGVGVDANVALPAPPPKSKEILSGIQLAMINRGALLLSEARIPRAPDYDAMVVQAGLFPRWLGGPLYSADRRGLMVVRAELRKLAASAPDLFTPDPSFDALIAKGRLFID